MKKNFTLAIVLVLAAMSASAQNQIKGLLTDNQTKSPVGFASVALFSLPDSATVKGVITGDDGRFFFDNLKTGSYFYKVKFMGYQDINSQPLSIDGKAGTKDLGTISLEVEAKHLDEVNVVGERLKGVENVDNTVYTIPESAIKTAGNGTDILKRIPAVQVDLSNNISLQGSSNIIILVDGKERDKDFVAQIDPSTIDKVEVSTNPSAKYDASVTGVINIVLKRQKRLGVSGNMDVEIPTSTDHLISSPSAGLDFGYNKFRFFTSVNGHFEGFQWYKDFDRITGNNKFSADGKGKFHYYSPMLHYGFDYFVDSKNTLSFYANYNPTENYSYYFYDKYVYANDQLTQYYTTDNASMNNRVGQFYSLFYKRNFKKSGHELTAEMNFYNNNSTSSNNYIDSYYETDRVTPDGAPIYRDERFENSRYSTNTKVDYKLPIKDKFVLEAGYQNYNQKIDNKSTYSDAASAKFNYFEARNAGYVQLGAKLKKWNLRAGVRSEFSDIYISDKKTSDYACVLPNATAQFTVDKTQNLKLSYRRSIRRPGSDDLNPAITYYDSLNMSKGNPNLNPSYSDKFQLNYSKNFGSNYFGPELFFTKNTDLFQRVVSIHPETNVMEINIENVGKGYEYGIGCSGSFQVTKWLMLNPYARVYKQHIEGIADALTYEIPQVDNVAWQANLYALVKLPKGYSLWSYATYNSPSVSFQTTNYRSPLYILGLEKTIMKEKGKLGINWYEPFKTTFQFNRQKTKDPMVYQDDNNHVKLYTLVSFKFTYRFNYGKEVKKLERQKSLENDNKGGMN